MDNPTYKEVSILIVEDDDIDAEGIQRALRKIKVANPFLRARDGIEGLEMMRSQLLNKPFLVLLDLNMPRMGGYEMLKEVRKDPLLTQSVIFVLTTSKDDEDRMKAYQEHIAGYILKSTLDTGFHDLVQLLDHYWRLVELPVIKK
ncbi:response regulator [uncultured Paraglaciecola sp.]|uniref:response regulator n=1 Tax=uncultured Paraglaciecola sp. TaxID=1765024 RepID=UPI00263673D2|nr:response regulator [uncultured Paraglaciecola sp.]